jgi:hypothetical protein
MNAGPGATTSEASTPAGPDSSLVDLQPEHRSTPVKFWASIGAVFLLVEAYVIVAWLTSGQATATPRGPTHVPGWMSVLAVLAQAGSVIAGSAVAYAFLIRPWIKQRRITADGILVLVFASVYWQDPLMSYAQNQLTYNSLYVNLGSWAPHLPGWVAPRAHLVPEPLLLIGPSYIWWAFGFVTLGNLVMRRAQARWPRIGRVSLILITYGFFALTIFVIESLMMRSGVWSFPSAIRSVTLWGGHYYQLPIYEVILAAAWWTALAALRFFKDRRGNTVVERGVESVSTSGRRRTLLRLLALVGAANSIFLGYNIAYVFIGGLHAGPWPTDIQYRSYLVDNLCGPGTTYACPGPGVPIPRPGSAHLAPSGELIPSG